MTDDIIERAHCNQCGQDTKHDVLHRRVQPGEEVLNPYAPEPPITINWSTTWTVLECRGCEGVTLKKEYWFSEWNPGDVEIEYFPPRLARRLPKWIETLHEPFPELIGEVYAALQAGSRRLAVMGVRAVFDLYMVEKIGDTGGFADKLKQLQREGYISRRDRETLATALDVGNAAAHRGYAPSSEHLENVIDIMENLLQADRLAEVSEEINKATPPRKKRETTK